MYKATFIYGLLLGLWFILGLIIVSNKSFAQVPNFRNHIHVLKQNRPLTFAWAGGMNCPQFSELDFNLDGKQDVFVFDRQDNSIATFIVQENTFVYAPEYSLVFPPLMDWVLLRDYDNDGDADVFTAQNSNIIVYKNLSKESGQFAFQFVKKLQSNYYTFKTWLYSAGMDLPGIVDVDGDGDLDILVNDVSGTQIEYHRNFCIENGLAPDSFALSLRSACWGHFQEIYDAGTGNYDIELGKPPCAHDGKRAHVGGCLLPIQLNGDTLIDLVISDYGNPSVVALYNAGTRQKAHFATKNLAFPDSLAPAYLYQMPAGYQLPNLNSLIFAPNLPDLSQDQQSAYYYQNKGTPLLPNYQLVTKQFLQSEMIDGGTGSYPCVIDYDKDGKQDILIGNYYRFGSSFASIACYRNDYPNLIWISDSVLPLPKIRAAAPAAGDLDADGWQDLLIGTESGNILYYQNQQGNFVKLSDTLIKQPLIRNAVPALFDLDADGDLDLVIGSGTGYLYLFENIGSPQIPNFKLKKERWGNIRFTDSLNNFIANASPMLLDRNKEGLAELWVSNASGNIFQFEGVCLDTDTLVPQPAWQYDFGTRTNLARFVWENQEYCIVGTARGGLLLLDFPSANAQTPECVPPPVTQPDPNTTFALFPNLIIDPHTLLTFALPEEKGELCIFDTQGKKLFQAQPTTQNFSFSPALLDLSAGMYLSTYQTNKKTYTQKFILLK